MFLQMVLYHPFSWLSNISSYIYIYHISFIHLSANGHFVYRWSDNFRPREGKLILFSKPCLIQGKVKFSEVLPKLPPLLSSLLSMSCQLHFLAPPPNILDCFSCVSWHLYSLSPSTSLAFFLPSFAR